MSMLAALEKKKKKKKKRRERSPDPADQLASAPEVHQASAAPTSTPQGKACAAQGETILACMLEAAVATMDCQLTCKPATSCTSLSRSSPDFVTDPYLASVLSIKLVVLVAATASA